MAYQRINFVNQQVERPRTYSMVENADNTVTLINSFGTITNIGTPINATNMNHIEDGIVACETALQTGLDTKVSKTGDTMTGRLNFVTNVDNFISVYGQNTNYDKTATSAPSSNRYALRVSARDGNSNYVGGFNIQHSTANNMVALFGTERIVGGETKYANISVGIHANGDLYTTAPTPTSATSNDTSIATTAWVVNHHCTDRPTTTPTASINAPSYIVYNYLNGTSGCIVYSDNYCEQWGQFTAQGFRTETTVNFLKNFVNTNYQILLSSNYFQGNGDKGSSCGWNTKNTNGCTIWCCFEQSQPIVSWRACGYLSKGQY